MEPNPPIVLRDTPRDTGETFFRIGGVIGRKRANIPVQRTNILILDMTKKNSENVRGMHKELEKITIDINIPKQRLIIECQSNQPYRGCRG